MTTALAQVYVEETGARLGHGISSIKPPCNENINWVNPYIQPAMIIGDPPPDMVWQKAESRDSLLDECMNNSDPDAANKESCWSGDFTDGFEVFFSAIDSNGVEQTGYHSGPGFIDTGKSAFVLFHYVNSCVQYDLLATWPLHLTLLCLYLLPLQTTCTNICSYHLSSIITNCDNAHLPGSPELQGLFKDIYSNGAFTDLAMGTETNCPKNTWMYRSSSNNYHCIKSDVTVKINFTGLNGEKIGWQFNPGDTTNSKLRGTWVVAYENPIPGRDPAIFHPGNTIHYFNDVYWDADNQRVGLAGNTNEACFSDCDYKGYLFLKSTNPEEEISCVLPKPSNLSGGCCYDDGCYTPGSGTGCYTKPDGYKCCNYDNYGPDYFDGLGPADCCGKD